MGTFKLLVFHFKECTTKNIRQMSVFGSLTRGRLCDPDKTCSHW